MTPIERLCRRFARNGFVVAALALAIMSTACARAVDTDWSRGAALSRGAVVEADGRILNPGPLAAFVQSVAERRSAVVQVVTYPSEAEPIVMTAEFDGQSIKLTREQRLDGGSAKSTAVCGGIEKRNGAAADAYMVTGCGGAEMVLAAVPKLIVASRIETAEYGAELLLETLPSSGNNEDGAVVAYRVEMRNLGEGILECGSDYLIEKQAYGTWIPVSYRDNVAFTANLVHLQKDESYEASFGFKMLESWPEPGRYRVVKEATFGKEKIKLAAEFDLPAK
ncbi:immunoglobulin-like domain-containing protein [Cohnella sp. GCM10020058]|uniref:immunoglobulin-like domain-containing protein n=1 Tax=Cohnella sp. GCM10020058 TaxID=3317330 RepID=UPI00362BEE94